MNEKTLDIQGLLVRYRIAGEGPALLILHGWGRGADSWQEVQESLSQQGYQVIVPDLPGFGQTPAPDSVWGVKEYGEFVSQFASKLGISVFSLIGHSFGGQIAVALSATHAEKLEKLILVAPAAIRKEPGTREHVIKYIAKIGNIMLSLIPTNKLRYIARKLFATVIGRSDYLESNGMMRKVMQKVIREDLTEVFSNITTTTLLVWGEQDRPVPVEDAYVMQKSITNASLEVLPEVGHRVHRQVPEQLVQMIASFLK